MPVIGHYEVRAQVGKPGIGKQVTLWQKDGDAGTVGVTARRAFDDALLVMGGGTPEKDTPLFAKLGSAEVIVDTVAGWTEIVLEGPNGLFDRVVKPAPAPEAPDAAPVA
jgi:hypothetical protein